jgi:hypothetical protein
LIGIPSPGLFLKLFLAPILKKLTFLVGFLVKNSGGTFRNWSSCTGTTSHDQSIHIHLFFSGFRIGLNCLFWKRGTQRRIQALAISAWFNALSSDVFWFLSFLRNTIVRIKLVYGGRLDPRHSTDRSAQPIRTFHFIPQSMPDAAENLVPQSRS